MLSIVGDVDPETAFAKAETYFGHLAAGAAEPAPPRRPAAAADRHGTRQETSADVPADAVYLTWRLPAAGTPAFDALDLAIERARARPDVPAAQAAGPRHRARRERLGQHHGADRRQLVRASRTPGPATGWPSSSSRTSWWQVDALSSPTGPTEPELRRAKAQFERHWLHELARIDSRADAFGEFATLHGDPTLVNSRLDQIDAVDMTTCSTPSPLESGTGNATSRP